MDPFADLPQVPTGKVGNTVYKPVSKQTRVSRAKIKSLEQRLADLKKKDLKPSQKGACTRMGAELAALINESNALGKRAQAIEKKIDELAVRIAKEGDICTSDKPKGKPKKK